MIYLGIEDDKWLLIKSENEWLQFFGDFLKAMCENERNVSVLLADDKAIRAINRRHRNIDAATNVLSFPHFSKLEVQSIVDGCILLGDIVMSYDSISGEALMFRKPVVDRVAHLFVHGVLHMLGFDHMTTEEQDVMENEEISILKKFGIENPYIVC